MSGNISKGTPFAAGCVFTAHPSGVNRAWVLAQNGIGGMTVTGWDQAVGDPLYALRGSEGIISDENQADIELAQTGGWYSNPLTPGQPSIAQLEADGNLTWTNPQTGASFPGSLGVAAGISYLLANYTDYQIESSLGAYLAWVRSLLNPALANIFASAPPPYVAPTATAEDVEFPPQAKVISNMIAATMAVAMQAQGGISPANAEVPVCTGFAPAPVT